MPNSLNQTKNRSREERFWGLVSKNLDGCFYWKGGTNERGAGLFSVMRDGMKMQQAHRYSWELHFGPIPAGKQVLHTCDHPACVNPDHLWLGTHADNMADMARKGRGRNGHTPGYRSKLTVEQVREIRDRCHWTNGWTWAGLGREYGVHEETIRRVVLEKTWRNVA